MTDQTESQRLREAARKAWVAARKAERAAWEAAWVKDAEWEAERAVYWARKADAAREAATTGGAL